MPGRRPEPEGPRAEGCCRRARGEGEVARNIMSAAASSSCAGSWCGGIGESGWSEDNRETWDREGGVLGGIIEGGLVVL